MTPEQFALRAVMRQRALAARLAKIEPRTPPEEMYRASGDKTCETCSLRYYDHPEHPGETWLTVLCDGSLVKL